MTDAWPFNILTLAASSVIGTAQWGATQTVNAAAAGLNAAGVVVGTACGASASTPHRHRPIKSLSAL